jgi:hypothetical protein
MVEERESWPMIAENIALLLCSHFSANPTDLFAELATAGEACELSIVASSSAGIGTLRVAADFKLPL